MLLQRFCALLLQVSLLAPRLCSTEPLKACVVQLLSCMVSILQPPAPQAPMGPSPAVAARAEAHEFEEAAAALLALVQADRARVTALLSASVADDYVSLPPWPDVRRSIKHGSTMKKPAYAQSRHALDTLDAAIIGGSVASADSACAAASAAAAEEAAAAAAASLLKVCYLACIPFSAMPFGHGMPW